MTAPRKVYFGNHQAVDVLNIEDETGKIVGQNRRPNPGKQCSTFNIPAGMPLMEALTGLTHPQGSFAHHSDAPAPAWVASSDWPALAAALADHYGCELRQVELPVEAVDHAD